jgi:hypothetical protein
MVDETIINEQIVLFADFDSANLARYEKVLVNKLVNNENLNNNANNKNNPTISSGTNIAAADSQQNGL